MAYIYIYINNYYHILIRSVSSRKVRTPEVALYASRLWTSDGRVASGASGASDGCGKSTGD